MTYLTVEENLKQFLQRNITIRIDDKILRQGRLILFNLKDYYLIFTLKIKNRNKTYELPYPFRNTFLTVDSLQFDYRLANLHNNEPTILKHNIFCSSKKSKLYDKVVTIEANE